MWPRKGDTLFQPGGYQHLAACIVTDFSLAATGYQDAASLLIASLNAAERNDALVFPIIFCYRQYLELKLKVLAGHLRAFAELSWRALIRWAA